MLSRLGRRFRRAGLVPLAQAVEIAGDGALDATQDIARVIVEELLAMC